MTYAENNNYPRIEIENISGIANAALHVVKKFHDITADDVRHAAQEWGNSRDADIPSDESAEGQQFYDAALRVVALVHGVTDIEGFRKYLAFRRGGAFE